MTSRYHNKYLRLAFLSSDVCTGLVCSWLRHLSSCSVHDSVFYVCALFTTSAGFIYCFDWRHAAIVCFHRSTSTMHTNSLDVLKLKTEALIKGRLGSSWSGRFASVGPCNCPIKDNKQADSRRLTLITPLIKFYTMMLLMLEAAAGAWHRGCCVVVQTKLWYKSPGPALCRCSLSSYSVTAIACGIVSLCSLLSCCGFSLRGVDAIRVFTSTNTWKYRARFCHI